MGCCIGPFEDYTRCDCSKELREDNGQIMDAEDRPSRNTGRLLSVLIRLTFE